MTQGRVERGVWIGIVSTAGALGASLLPGCSGPTLLSGTGSDAVVRLSAEETAELLSARAGQADFLILDVRTPEEFATGHLDGAVNLCLTCDSPPFADAVAGLRKESTYLVYCRSGNRSATAAAIMADQGFVEVYDLGAGAVAWQAAGLPLVE